MTELDALTATNQNPLGASGFQIGFKGKEHALSKSIKGKTFIKSPVVFTF